MDADLKPTVLVIADISGYTRFMLSTRQAQVHSVVIIHELMDAMIREIDVPLAVSKLEGDAVFMYAAKDADESTWARHRTAIGNKLIQFFELFSAKIIDLAGSTMCRCGACDNIDRLKLKMVVHSGQAVFAEVGGSEELGGIDVVTVHLLLKNSVPADEYILMTEPAWRDIEFPGEVHLTEGAETYDEMGTVETRIYLPGSEEQRAESIADRRKSASVLARMRTTMGTMMRSLPMLIGLTRHPDIDDHGPD